LHNRRKSLRRLATHWSAALAPRFRDHNAQVGNLHPGQNLFGEPILDTFPAGRAFTYEAELARIRAHTFGHAYVAPVYRSAPFKTRSLRRT
jgi:hypothetical protein